MDSLRRVSDNLLVIAHCRYYWFLCSKYKTVAATRERTLSLRSRLRICTFTVSSEICSCEAICLLDRPRATSCSTSSSRSVRSANGSVNSVRDAKYSLMMSLKTFYHLLPDGSVITAFLARYPSVNNHQRRHQPTHRHRCVNLKR